MDKSVEVCKLSISFKQQEVLKAVSYDFGPGKIYGLVGRNGSGKSVLMKCISGLLLPTEGYVHVFGKRLGRDVDFAPSTGIAIEQPGLLLHKSARKNMEILSELRHKADDKEISKLLSLVGLMPNDTKSVKKYSMGMKQRLSIAMALLDNPNLLLLDEPLSNLDKSGAQEMREVFKKLASEGKTLIIATHIKEDVMHLCDTVCTIENGALNCVIDKSMG